MSNTHQTTLDWEAMSVPMLFDLGERGTRPITNRVAVLRDDSYEMIGQVSPTYEIFTNAALKNLVAPMVEEGLLEIVNMGELGGGSRVFIQAQMTEEFKIVGEEHKAMLTYLNSHDGGTPLSAGVTDTRVVCSNTFAQAMTDMDQRLRHFVGVTEKAASIQQTTKFINDGMKKFQEAAEVLATTKCTTVMVDKVIAKAFGKKDASEVRARGVVQELFRDGQGNEGKSLWDAFNAITEYNTHRSKKTEKGRFQYAHFGTGAFAARRALDACLALS